MRVPPGIEGTVINVKVFSRSGVRKDKRYKDMVALETTRLESDFAMQMMSLENMLREKMIALLDGAKAHTGKATFTRENLEKLALKICLL